MKNYLYSISPEVCQVVCDGVDFSDYDDQPNRINYKRFIIMLKQSPSSPHQLTRKNSTVQMVWMWPRMFGQHFGWPMRDLSS
jgi:hypothetical protein